MDYLQWRWGKNRRIFRLPPQMSRTWVFRAGKKKTELRASGKKGQGRTQRERKQRTFCCVGSKGENVRSRTERCIEPMAVVKADRGGAVDSLVAEGIPFALTSLKLTPAMGYRFPFLCPLPPPHSISAENERYQTCRL